jgi:hypothetical protein
MRAHRFVAVLLVLVAAPSAGAQMIGVRGMLSKPSGGDVVSVAGAEVRVRLGTLPLVLATSAQSGRGTLPFVFCAGLIPPDGDCSPKPAHVRTRVRALALELPIASGTDAFQLLLAPRLAMVWTSGRWDHPTRVERWTDDHLGPAVGLDLGARVRLGRRLPLYATLGGQGLLVGTLPVSCADCFVPSFDDGYRAASFFVGLEYAPRLR